MRPRVRVVKDVDVGRLDLLWLHHLDADSPRGVVSFLDGIEKVLDVVVGLGSCQPNGRVCIQGLDPFFRPKVPFDVDIASILPTVIVMFASWRVDRELAALLRVYV